MIDVRRLGQDLAALTLLAVTAFLGLALFSFDPADPPGGAVWPLSDDPANLCGPAGAAAAWHLRSALGLAAWLAWARLAWVDLRLFAREATPEPALKLVGWGLTLLAVCAGLSLLVPGANVGVPSGGGGLLGAYGSAILGDAFSAAGTGVLLASVLAAGLLLGGGLRGPRRGRRRGRVGRGAPLHLGRPGDGRGAGRGRPLAAGSSRRGRTAGGGAGGRAGRESRPT